MSQILLIINIIILFFCVLLTLLEKTCAQDAVYQQLSKQISTNDSNTSSVITMDDQPTDPDINTLSYKFAIIWPTGYLMETHCRDSRLPNRFTIHGLWALDRTKPKPPPSPQMFDYTLLADIKDDMQKYWPDVLNYEDYDAYQNFWAREWDSHGRSDPNYKNDFHEYFSHTLNLLESLDATKIIIDKSGLPNTPQSLREALVANGKTRPFLLCTTDGPNVYLSEIHFCMDYAAVTFVDCAVPKPPESLDRRL